MTLQCTYGTKKRAARIARPAPVLSDTIAMNQPGFSSRLSFGDPLNTIDNEQIVPAMKKKNGEVQTAHGTGSVLMCTTVLISMKMVDAKMADIKGAMRRPPKMAPRPWPPFQPHSTFAAPTAATPTPVIDETSEYVDET